MKTDTHVAATALAFGALLVTMVAEAARTLFPAVYLMGEDGSFVVAGLLALAIYAAPVVALLVPSLDPRTRLALGAIAIVVARLALQFAHPIPSWLAMGATAIVLLGATLAAGAVVRDRRPLAIAVVLGLALDTALRTPFRSWDLAWQDGAGAIATTLAVAAAAVLVLRLVWTRLPDATDATGPGLSVASLGPYLALQLLFLQNVGFVGSQAGVGFALATSIVLIGDALALTALAVAFVVPATRGVWAVGAFGAAALTFALPSLVGLGSIATVLGLQVLATLGLGWVLAAPSRSSGRASTILGAAGAALSFLLVALLWQLHIDSPLPFPRASVPAAAALALWIAAALAARKRQVHGVAPRSIPVLVSAVAIVAVGLGAWLSLDRPSEAPAAPTNGIVRVVQYNVRGTLGPDGQLDPDAVARAIASSNPDVVVLQEVARGWPIFGAGDALARLQQRLDMPYRFEPAADGQFGNAILSRLPMEPVSAGTLPEVPGKQTRSYLAVRVDVGGDEPLLVIGTHLESDDVAQIEAILDVLEDASPALLAGDLNMQPDDVENVRRFTDSGLVDAQGATGDPCRTTSAEPTSDCDRVSWVFVTSDVEILGLRIGTVVASDHLPVHVRIAVPA